MKTKHLTLAIPAVLSLSLAVGSAFVTLPFMTDAAFAKNENANSGNKGGNSGNSNIGGNGKGAVASELKGMNAAHANENALLNAAANSQVGKIALYKTAAQATTAAAGNLAYAEQYLADNFPEYDGTSSSADIQAEIDAILLADPTADVSDLEALRDAVKAVEDAEKALADAEAAEKAALDAACGCDSNTLSDEAITELRAMLGL